MAFNIGVGPHAHIKSTFSDFNTSSSGLVTKPCIPVEPSSVHKIVLAPVLLKSSCNITALAFLKPVITVASAPNLSANGNIGGVPIPPPIKTTFLISLLRLNPLPHGAIISNIAGSTIEECVTIAEKLNETDVHMIELNISCPNVKKGGATFGVSCEGASEITRAVRKATSKPLIVKLSPNVTSIVDIAKAVECEGADSISLINTLLGMRIDINTKRPILKNNMGGLSGPAVFPVAVRMVWQVSNAVKVPVIGMGGVSSGKDAIEMMMAGARAVQVGGAIFTNPNAPIQIIDEMNQWLDNNGIKDINEIVGSVVPW